MRASNQKHVVDWIVSNNIALKILYKLQIGREKEREGGGEEKKPKQGKGGGGQEGKERERENDNHLAHFQVLFFFHCYS